MSQRADTRETRDGDTAGPGGDGGAPAEPAAAADSAEARASREDDAPAPGPGDEDGEGRTEPAQAEAHAQGEVPAPPGRSEPSGDGEAAQEADDGAAEADEEADDGAAEADEEADDGAAEADEEADDDDDEWDESDEASGDTGLWGEAALSSGAPHASAGAVVDPEVRLRRSRLMRKNRELKAEKARLRTALIAVSAVLSVALGVALLRIVQGLDHEDQLEAALARSRAETQRAEEALDDSRRQVSELVRNRIPGVRPVEYDAVIEIGEHPVRNITFTVTRALRDVSYEVRAVLENDTSRAVEPRIDLLLLGPLGLELGRAVIGEEEDAESAGAMLPGEVRSFTTSVSIERGEEPAYFLLQSR